MQDSIFSVLARMSSVTISGDFNAVWSNGKPIYLASVYALFDCMIRLRVDVANVSKSVKNTYSRNG